MLCLDKIIISNDDFATYNTLLSGNGLYLERNDKKARIVINPGYGIQIDKNVGTSGSPTWNNTLYTDLNGTLHMSGDINMERGSINWSYITPPTAAEIGAKPYDWLPEYGDITGLKPPINADNTSAFVGNKLTHIDAYGIYTGTLTAQQINAIQGITLGANATIQWASLPSLPTASQIGAKPYSWNPAYTDITGSKPPINADNTANYVGNKLSYIDPYGAYFGTLSADQITAGTISADRISTNISQVDKILRLGTYTDRTTTKYLYFNDSANIRSHWDGIQTGLVVSANSFSLYDPSHINIGHPTTSYITCRGNWDFNDAAVQGLTAVFG